jgi:hypothetical protein
VRTDVKLGLINGEEVKEFNLKQFHLIFTHSFSQNFIQFCDFYKLSEKEHPFLMEKNEFRSDLAE